jgi:hypothetical protein
MAKRDLRLCAIYFAVLCLAFLRLLTNPGLIPGNFGDIYIYHYPLRLLVTSTMQAGRLPLWNPYIFAGTPLAANPQAVLFYPISAVHRIFPMAWSFSIEAFLHLAWAWLGAFLLLRKWRLDRAGAWMLALAYGLSPFLVLRIPQGIPTHLAGLSWIPWVWLCVQSRKRLLWSLALALQILSGHPQFAVINLLAMGLWALLRRPKLLLWLVPGGALAICLDWAQIGPTMEFLGRSVRALWGSVFSLGYSLKLSHLMTLFYFNALGNPIQNHHFEFPSEFFEMMTCYIGVLPLGLTLMGIGAGLSHRRDLGRTLSLLAIIGFGLFFSLGENNPLYMSIRGSLGLDFLRVPARFSIVILWALWMGAAITWRTYFSHKRLFVKCIFIGLTACDLMWWSLPWIYPEDAGNMAPNAEIMQIIHDPNYRYATSPDIPTSNKSMLYRISNLAGYEAFYLAPIAIFTRLSEGQPSADGSRIYIQKWDTPAMAHMAVRHYFASEPPRSLAPRHQVGLMYIYENENAMPIVQGAKTWQSLSAERWVATTDAPGRITFAQADYPGWRAWVNGVPKPKSVQLGLFPSVQCGGTRPCTIYFTFQPSSWFLGVWFSLLLLALILVRSLEWLHQWKF